MIYIYTMGFLFFCFLIGKVVLNIFGIRKAKHPIIYGLFTYFLLTFTLTMPLVFLHVSWDIFFYMQTALHIIMLGIIGYFFLKGKIKIKCSFSRIKKNIKTNWGLYTVFVVFTFAYLMSNSPLFFSEVNARFGLAIIDNKIYLGRALLSIGSDAIMPLNIDVLTRQTRDSDIILLISYWELFWAYGSQVLHVQLLSFVHTLIPFIIYIFVFFTVDEMMTLLLKNTENREVKVQLTMLSFLLLYFFIGYDSELNKFLFMPWYGNVVAFMLLIPLFIVICYYVFVENKLKLFYILFPFVMTGFSPVSILFIGVLYLILSIWLLKQKTWRNKNLLLYIYTVMIAFVFISVSVYSAVKLLEYTRFLHLFTNVNPISEMTGIISSLSLRLPIIAIGLMLFYLGCLNNKVTKIEKVIIIPIFLVLLLVTLPISSVFLFNILGFPLRRLTESLILYMFIYSCYKIIIALDYKAARLMLATFVYIAFLYPVNGIFFLKNANFYRIENIVNQNRVPDLAKKLEEYLVVNQIEGKSICIYNGYGSAIETDMGFVELAYPVLLSFRTNSIYLWCNEESRKDIADTTIIWANDADGIEQLRRENYTNIGEIESVEGNIYIFQRS